VDLNPRSGLNRFLPQSTPCRRKGRKGNVVKAGWLSFNPNLCEPCGSLCGLCGKILAFKTKRLFFTTKHTMSAQRTQRGVVKATWLSFNPSLCEACGSL